jgi:predicted amidohydrolase
MPLRAPFLFLGRGRSAGPLPRFPAAPLLFLGRGRSAGPLPRFPAAPLLLAALLVACNGGGGGPDLALPDATAADRGAGEAAIPSLTVAAIQYAEGDHLKVPGCTDNFCALAKLVDEAAAKGAKLVVLPEYALGQKTAEKLPAIGAHPASDVGFSGSHLWGFAKQAKERELILVVNLITTPSSGQLVYNSQVALGPDGAVLGVHHKFNLFGNEKQELTAGTEVSVFESPLGKIGLLICADIYAEAEIGSQLPRELSTKLKARVVAVSADWLTASAMSTFWFYAKGYKVYAVVANTTAAPGQGGGVWAPNGDSLVETKGNTPSVQLARIPLP